MVKVKQSLFLICACGLFCSIIWTIILVFFVSKPSTLYYQDVLSRKILSLEDLIIRNQRRSVEGLNHLQKALYSSVKRILPKSFPKQNNDTFYEQMIRRQRISDVCQAFASSEEGMSSSWHYPGRSPLFSQTIQRDAFLIAQTPPSVLCYNHKVASSTWMSAFTKLLGDEAYFQQLLESGAFYKIKDRMNPWSVQDLLETLSSGNYFSFTVVRHPFDRLVSAYRDRILHGCTDQSKHFVPQIFALTRKRKVLLGTSRLFDEISGCIKVLPTFREFIQYIVDQPEKHDPHWMTFNKHCSPCLIDYDAIIKLETAQMDQAYVLQQSNMDHYVQLEYRHKTVSDTTGTSLHDLRKSYFSNVTCDELIRLEYVYKMDLQMFDYSVEPFKDLCVQ